MNNRYLLKLLIPIIRPLLRGSSMLTMNGGPARPDSSTSSELKALRSLILSLTKESKDGVIGILILSMGHCAFTHSQPMPTHLKVTISISNTNPGELAADEEDQDLDNTENQTPLFFAFDVFPLNISNNYTLPFPKTITHGRYCRCTDDPHITINSATSTVNIAYALLLKKYEATLTSNEILGFGEELAKELAHDCHLNIKTCLISDSNQN